MVPMLLKVPLGDGSDEFVEVEVDYADVGEAVTLTAGEGRDVAVAPYSLASSMDRVIPALRTIVTRLRTDEHSPDEIAMQLGLKVGGETGLVFAKGTAEATFTVSLTWHKPAPAGVVEDDRAT